MKRPSEKDLYSILGVDPYSSQEDIHNAYKARARIIHPDRFDKLRQPQDWSKANEMLAELNEAYSILRNASSRAEYDQIRSRKQQHQSAPPPPRPEPKSQPQPAFEHGEITPGQASYVNLPKNIQAKLLKRQENKGVDQFQVKLSSIEWNYVYIAIMLCWFWYLFSDANGTKWSEDTIFFYCIITLAVGYFISKNAVKIIKWQKATLKPYFYVTPIYFIKTDYDFVSFHPIWSLKDVVVTHNYKYGAYRNSDIVLKFVGHNEFLSLSSKDQVNTMFNRIKTYEGRLNTAYANGTYEYFRIHDDFLRLSRSKFPQNYLLAKRLRVFIFSLSIVLCCIGFFIAIARNYDQYRKRLIYNSSPSTYTSLPSKQVTKFTVPEQPLPYSGIVRNYTTSEKIAPLEIDAAIGNHYLVRLADAFTNAPVLDVFVCSGTKVNIDVPLGTFEIRYACGDSWYGYEHLFGPDTSYSKAEKKFKFEIIGNQVSGFTITLYEVVDGNLQTSTIRPDEF